jgi:hypothetical protein
MKKSLLVSALAIFMLIIGLTTYSFAYWDSLSTRQTPTIDLGEGTTLVVSATATVPNGKTLVPTSVILGANDVKEIVLNYDVVLSKKAYNDLTLSVMATNVTIGNDETYANLVNITINPTTTNINNDKINVTVVITLSEPEDEVAYLAIKNQPIKFDLNFSAIQ